MLAIIGLGLCNEKDITLKALEFCKNAEKVYVELYTNLWQGNLESLQNLIGKQIVKLKRSDIEEGYAEILDEAKSKNVALLVPGDPFVATTHDFLLREAERKGIEVKIIHNASIISAVAKTGLHIYKFGATVTIPLSYRTSEPASVIEKIKANLSNGMHTLCLLDIDVERNEFLKIADAIKFLLDNNVINEDTKLLVVSKIGCDDEKIIFASAHRLMELNIELPASIVVPANLHFSEEENLRRFSL